MLRRGGARFPFSVSFSFSPLGAIMSVLLIDPVLRAARREVDEQTDRGAAIIEVCRRACVIARQILATQWLSIISGVTEAWFAKQHCARFEILGWNLANGFAVELRS